MGRVRTDKVAGQGIAGLRAVAVQGQDGTGQGRKGQGQDMGEAGRDLWQVQYRGRAGQGSSGQNRARAGQGSAWSDLGGQRQGKAFQNLA